MRRRAAFVARWAVMFTMILFLPIPAFIGTEAADRGADVMIPVSCIGEGTAEKFQYVLSCEDTENQNVECATLTLKDGEEGEFHVSYSCPGLYHYTVSQKTGTDSRTMYDSTVYEVDVYVEEDENGVMYAEPVVHVQGDAEKKANLSFVNKKKDSPGTGSSGKSGTSISEKDMRASVKTSDTVQTEALVCMFGSIAVVLLLAVIKRGKTR